MKMSAKFLISPYRLNYPLAMQWEINSAGWPPYWPTGRLADNQKLRNLTDNLRKILFRKRTNKPQFFSSTSVMKVCPWSDRILSHASRAMAMPQRPVGLDESITTKLLIYGPIMDFYYQLR